jgi:hypothetical protein
MAFGKSEYSVNVDHEGKGDCVVKSTCGIDGEPVDARRESFEVDESWVERGEHGTMSAGLASISKDTVTMSMSLVFLAYLVGSALFPKKQDSGRFIGKDAVQRSDKKPSAKKTSVAMSINSKLMKLATAEEVLSYALEMMDHTDVVNLVTAIHRSAKLSLASGKVSDTRNNPKLLALVTQLSQSLTEADVPISVKTRAVGNTSWALAKIGARQAWFEVVDVLHDIFCRDTEEFKPEELMNTVWAFSEISKIGDKVVEARVVGIAVALGRFNDGFDKLHLQQVVYFAWALARLSQIGMVKSNEEAQTGIMQYRTRIIGRVTDEVERLTTNNMSMLAWALTNLARTSKKGSDLEDGTERAECEEELAAILRLLGDQGLKLGLWSFAPGEVASVCWALAKSRVGHEEFFEAYAAHLMKNGLKGYGYQDLSNILCAYVNAHCGKEPFFDMLCFEVTRHAAGFNRIEKTMVNTALLKLGRPQLPPTPLGRTPQSPER